MTADELIRVATFASRRALRRNRPDCIQEAILEMLARPDRHPIRAAENGSRRWLHRERRQCRRRVGPPVEGDRVTAPPDHTPGLDVSIMLAILSPRDADVLIASAVRSRAGGCRREGAAPWSSKQANIAARARDKIRSAFPHYQEA
jgi:hypothetical protein